MIVKRAFPSLLIALLALAACSSDDGDAATAPMNLMLKGAVGLLTPKTDPVDPRDVLTRSAIDASPVQIILAGVESREAYATLTEAGQNQGVKTWITGDDISLAFRDGVLVATRGLGADLMAADVRDVIATLRSGNGTALRIHDYLNGEDQTVRRSFHCEIRNVGREQLNIYGLGVAVRHMTESCQNPDIQFQNDFWIAQNGRIWQSRQWISPALGHVSIQHLSR